MDDPLQKLEECPGPEESGRRRIAMIRLLVLTMILLALPVGMVVWGVRDWVRKDREDAQSAELPQNTGEPSALRSALENVVDQRWGSEPGQGIPDVPDSRGLIPLVEARLAREDFDAIATFLQENGSAHPGKVLLLKEERNGTENAVFMRWMIDTGIWHTGILPAARERWPGLMEQSTGGSPGAFLFLEISAL